MDRKAQAAMEFLMTYGWAILAAVIVIGVLASFGVFSPSKYVATTCLLAAPFGCDENQVAASANDATGGVSLVIRNGGGTSYAIQNVVIEGCAGIPTFGGLGLPQTIGDQATGTIYVPCGASLTEDDKFSGDVTVTYQPIGGALNLTSTGSIVVSVGA